MFAFNAADLAAAAVSLSRILCAIHSWKACADEMAVWASEMTASASDLAAVLRSRARLLRSLAAREADIAACDSATMAAVRAMLASALSLAARADASALLLSLLLLSMLASPRHFLFDTLALWQRQLWFVLPYNDAGQHIVPGR